MSEYYIRREGDEDASGPYNMDQITSLVEAGKLDKTAFYYDIEKEEWLPISGNEALMGELYPEKKKLSLRKEPEPSEEEKAEQAKKEKKPKLKKKEKEEEPKGITIEAMLAQAEGREGDDPSGKSPLEKKSFAAFLALRSLTLLSLLSAIVLGVIDLEVLLSANIMEYYKSPYIIVGFIDFIFFVCLLLQVTDIYPLIRFRAAVGAGLFTLLFYATGEPILIIGNLLLMVSFYFGTAVINTSKAVITLVIGSLGILGFAYVLLSSMFISAS